MKKILLVLFVGLCICACSQKETKPALELEEGEATLEGALSSMAKTFDKAINTNEDFNANDAKVFYFSDTLKNAVLNCTPYQEDVYERNPKAKQMAAKGLKLFFGDIDTSFMKFLIDVKGKKEDKCQVSLSYDYQITQKNYNCNLDSEMQKKLFAAMNDTSGEEKTRAIKAEHFSMTMTATEWDLTLNEMINNSCKEEESSQTDLEKRQKEMQQKMLAFSDRFKNSLKNCTPDTEVFKVMGMEMNKVKIKGKEKGKCHVVLQGFHIMLNDNELSLSGFDELGKLVSDEKRATYSPSYKYQGTLFALSECEQLSKNANNQTTLGEGTEDLSLSDTVQLTRGVNSSYKNNACNLSFVLKMTRNGKTEDHSLLCNLTAEQLAQHIKPYSNLLAQYGPKIEISENSFSSMGGRQTEEVSKADMNLFLKLYKSGICKKGN